MKTSTIEVGGLLSVPCARGVEKRLSRLPGGHRAEVICVFGSTTVKYDEAEASLGDIKAKLDECGHHCGGALVPWHLFAPEVPPGEAMAGTISGGHESTAARLAALGRHADHLHPMTQGAQAEAGTHAAHDRMGQDMGFGAGMKMAEMICDMGNRFWICLVSTPIFLYAPIGMQISTPHPPFGLGMSLRLFLLASAAILSPSWPFSYLAGIRPASPPVSSTDVATTIAG